MSHSVVLLATTNLTPPTKTDTSTDNDSFDSGASSSEHPKSRLNQIPILMAFESSKIEGGDKAGETKKRT